MRTSLTGLPKLSEYYLRPIPDCSSSDAVYPEVIVLINHSSVCIYSERAAIGLYYFPNGAPESSERRQSSQLAFTLTYQIVS
jgi:hypothetical protein